MPYKILVVEDDALQRKMIGKLLERHLEMIPIEADSARQALEILRNDESNSIQLVLADHYMPEMDGSELLQIITQQYPHLPVIMLTGTKDIRIAVEAMKMGACDFLTKPPEVDRLQVSILNALKLRVLEKEVTRLKRKDEGTFTFNDLIGHDKGLADIIRVGKKAAASEIPVLLLGETGVGKEVFARAIHGESKRVGKAFVAVNCGAIPEQLVESTLFGHEKGAFTGAVAKSIGRFREAEGGTIFLDEIGELPLDAQVKILRALQQREIVPVGSSKSIPINVRIISATNRKLDEEVKKGAFRDDLYFRLNVLTVHLPALRERRNDIPALVHHFMDRYTSREGIVLKDLSDTALHSLCHRNWPGNVRELENTIHRAVVLSEGKIMEVDDFVDLSAPQSPFANLASLAALPLQQGAFSLYDTTTGRMKMMDEIEQEIMHFALKASGDNVTKAADLLGIAKSTFYRRMKA